MNINDDTLYILIIIIGICNIGPDWDLSLKVIQILLLNLEKSMQLGTSQESDLDCNVEHAPNASLWFPGASTEKVQYVYK